MTTQRTMFDVEAAPPQYDGIPLPEQVPAERTATQRDKILALLRQGSVTNFELADICIRYSARIHELRKEGHEIETVARLPGKDKDSALVVYRLKEQG